MLKPAFLALAALTSLCVAQSPLNTLTGGTNSGNIGGGIYFDLQVNTTVTINQIDIRCGANTVAGTGTMDIYLGPSTYVGNVTNSALWTLVSSTTPSPVAPSAVTAFPVSSPFALGPGNYGIALKSNGYSNGYTNGNGTATPGSGTNQTFSNAELTLRGGAAQNAFLTGGIFAPRIFNGAISYTLGGTPIAVAAWEKFGTGCYDRSRSFFEFWPSSASVDLGTVPAGGSGVTSMFMQNVGNRYFVSGGTAAMYTHTGTAVSLGLGDDIEQAVSLDPTAPQVIPYVGASGPTLISGPNAVINMCSNGFLSIGGTNAALVAINPAPAQFLSGSTIIGNWHDFDPSQAGASTQYEWAPTLGTAGAHVFSWLACPDFGIAATSNNFQVLVYEVTGDIECRWGAMSQSGGGSWPTVTGFSVGGGARNDGGSDLSARLLAGSFLTGDVDNAPLDLSLSSRPLLGGTPGFSTSNMEPTQGAGFLFLGFVGIPTGVPLTAFGMPECAQWLNTNGAITTLFFGNPGTVNFQIANSPSFNGVQIFGQSACFGSAFNAAFGVGVNASNGVRMTLGNL